MKLMYPNPAKKAIRKPAYWVENLTDTQFVYLLLLPPFAVLSLIAFWPLIQTFDMSLHANNLQSEALVGEYIGFENYVDLFTGNTLSILSRPFIDFNSMYTSTIPVTLFYTVISVSIAGILGLGQAAILNKSFRGRGWVRLSLLLPWAVPIAIHGMIFYLLFTPGIGFVSGFLFDMGLISEAPLAQSADATWITIIANVWKITPFIALITLAGMQSINRDLYAVADVAGASAWQTFKFITLPLILPAFLIALLFSTIRSVKVYGIITIISSCSTVPSLTCGVVQTFQARNYGSSAAIAFVTAVVIAFIVAIYMVALNDNGV